MLLRAVGQSLKPVKPFSYVQTETKTLNNVGSCWPEQYFVCLHGNAKCWLTFQFAFCFAWSHFTVLSESLARLGESSLDTNTALVIRCINAAGQVFLCAADNFSFLLKRCGMRRCCFIRCTRPLLEALTKSIWLSVKSFVLHSGLRTGGSLSWQKRGCCSSGCWSKQGIRFRGGLCMWKGWGCSSEILN